MGAVAEKAADLVSVLAEKVEAESDHWKSSACCHACCSWKDPLLSLRRNHSDYGEGRVKGSRRRTSENHFLLSTPGFW